MKLCQRLSFSVQPLPVSRFPVLTAALRGSLQTVPDTTGSSLLLKEPPRVDAIAVIYSAQQHAHYAAWQLKKIKEGREGVSSRSAAFKIYACLMQRWQNRSRRNALFCC